MKLKALYYDPQLAITELRRPLKALEKPTIK